jgi:hypothetical protein
MVGVLGIIILQIIYMDIRGISNFLNMDKLSDWRIYHYALLFIDLLVAGGAAYSSFINSMAFAEEARQYQRMTDLFFRSEKKINFFIHEKKWEMVSLIIFELGKETLTENGDWLLMKRSRPIEIPTG